jgi:uncharacterized membrane protein YkvA (DUF1232 family)
MKFLKDLKDFLTNVARDPEIPERDQKVLLGLIVLLVSPIDLIPDWIPLLGLLDDFIILGLILDYFFDVLDNKVLLRHYPWGMKSFAHIRRVARFIALFVPDILKRKIWAYKKDPFS